MSAADYGFTCVTCQLQFKTAGLQREHFTKSDLHRYNAKRKVADLPPVTAEVFNDKIAERHTQLAAGAAARKLDCKACDKKFNSQNAYDDHLNSKKHRDNVLKAVKNMSVETLMGKKDIAASASDDNSIKALTAALDNTSVTSPPESSAEDTEATASTSKAPMTMPKLEPTSCLFCPRTFESMEVNLKHMAHNHAFYIPDEQYCVNKEGLLKQLGEDIALGNICIFCGHGFGGFVTGSESDAELVKRAHRGLHAVRKHMVDKIHCRIPWDTDDQRLEYSDHYDFTSSWGTNGEDGEMEVEDSDVEEWEDEDGSDINEEDEVVMDYSAIRKKTRTQGEDLLESRLQQGESEYELVLPSGTRIGHRSLKGIYKANVMRKSTSPL